MFLFNSNFLRYNNFHFNSNIISICQITSVSIPSSIYKISLIINLSCRYQSAKYCLVSIVLHLYIYIALLQVHTNQERFHCERPREKRAVLRERKEALGSPVNKVDRVEGKSWFQSKGPMIAKVRV